MTSARRIGVTRAAARLWWLPLAPLGFLADRGSRLRWLLMPAVVILTALTSSLGKLAVRRPRPGSGYRVVPWGHLGVAGFPSTHSACAFATARWLRGSRHGRWLHVVAVLIGYSRVRCRAHHPTDVVAGAVLGYGVSWQVERVWLRARSIGPRPRTIEAVAEAPPAVAPETAPPEPRDRVVSPTRLEMPLVEVG